MFMTLLLSLTLCGAPKVDEKLVGTWLAGSAPFITLNANGTGTMEEGKVKWSADGQTLIVTDDENGVDKLGYAVNGGTLTLNMGGMPLALTRAGAGVQVKKQGPLAARAEKANRVSEEEADKEAMIEAQAWLQKNGQGQPGLAAQPQPQQQGQRAPQQGQAPRGAGTDQLSQLLLSSAWCSFHYNKVSGASSSTRYQFYRDGTWSTGGRTETYNSGAYGSMAGQYDSSNRGRWESRGGQLWMSSPENPVLQPLGALNVTRNSNGSPIINANGQEFSSCN